PVHIACRMHRLERYFERLPDALERSLIGRLNGLKIDIPGCIRRRARPSRFIAESPTCIGIRRVQRRRRERGQPAMLIPENGCRRDRHGARIETSAEGHSAWAFTPPPLAY